MDNNPERKEQSGKYKPSRRELIKLVSAAGAGALVGGASNDAMAASNGGVSSQTFSLFEKEYETIDDMYDISKDIRRFDQKYTALMRGMWDEEVRPSTISYGAKKMGL
ncbi:MAG: twin-arginine translocation signal domain-containing protein, partial [Deltaproteobacteria bacterium]|nr:twin-arginine translocation signal domain-containing protein [Deltaproteobacteria bacterium]